MKDYKFKAQVTGSDQLVEGYYYKYLGKDFISVVNDNKMVTYEIKFETIKPLF